MFWQEEYQIEDVGSRLKTRMVNLDDSEGDVERSIFRSSALTMFGTFKYPDILEMRFSVQVNRVRL
jgi:hypothetical protein